MGSQDALSRRALLNHPQAVHRIRNASLPSPALDPNPRLTLALFRLWDYLQPFVSLEVDIEFMSFIRPLDVPNLRLLDVLQSLYGPLVCI